MTNLPTLPKNSDYYELFSERENRKQVTKLLKNMKVKNLHFFNDILFLLFSVIIFTIVLLLSYFLNWSR